LLDELRPLPARLLGTDGEQGNPRRLPKEKRVPIQVQGLHKAVVLATQGLPKRGAMIRQEALEAATKATAAHG
jgi:hypothetical protein